MYLRCELELFVWSMVFTIVPLLISLILIIYFLYRWRILTTTALHRLTEYLHKFSVVLILWTIAADFYSCILLVRSKLFYFDVFNLPLTQEEMDNLIVFKFINTTLFENIPLMVIQLIFLSNNDASLVALFSLTLTMISLVSSIAYFISRAINYRVKYSQHVRQITEYEVRFTMYCERFCPKHAFINDILRDEIVKAIEKVIIVDYGMIEKIQV